jgi:drug/metabolite transporter (DMT)-like permease
MDLLTITAFIFSAIGAAAVFFDKKNEAKVAKQLVARDESINGGIILPSNYVGAQPKDTINRTQIAGVVLILSCSMLWGVEHVLARSIVSGNVDPIATVIWRQIATAIFIGLFALMIKPFSKFKAKKVPLHFDKDAILMIGGRGLAGVFYMLALTHLTASTTIVLYKLSGFFAFIFTLYMLAHRLPKFSIGVVVSGLMCSLLGVAAASIISGKLFGGDSGLGYLFAILAPFCWGLFLVHSERHESSGLTKTDLYLRTAFLSKIIGISSIIPIVTFFLIPLLGGSDFSTEKLMVVPKDSFYDITLLGLIQAGTAILYFESVKRISAVFVSVLVSTEILATIFLESLLFDLQLNMHIAVAAVLLTIGAYLVSTESQKFKLST